MNRDDFIRIALEALELYQSKSSVQMFDDAVKALRQALETQQEPVAWMHKKDTIRAALEAAVAWAAPMADAPKSSRPEWFDQAREALSHKGPIL